MIKSIKKSKIGVHSSTRHLKLTMLTVTYFEKDKEDKVLMKENPIKVYVQGEDFFILQIKNGLELYNEDAELQKTFSTEIGNFVGMLSQFNDKQIDAMLFEKENKYYIYSKNGELLEEFEKELAEVKQNKM
jgi:hypothetical protein